MRIEGAKREDAEAIVDLLNQVELPAVHVEEQIDGFLVARQGGIVRGCVGMEIYGDSCLLRSLAVHPDFQGQGIGRKLTEAIIARARKLDLQKAVVLTYTAAGLVAKFGFVEVERCAVNGPISDSWEFKTHACDSAVCMKLELASS